MTACVFESGSATSPSTGGARPSRPSSGKLRIAQLAVTLMIGGSERLAASIGRGLDPDQFEVVFGALAEDGPIGESLRGEGFVARAFQRRPGFDYRVLFRAWKFLREQKVDVVQTHHVAALIYGGIAARLAGARLIHTEHEINTFKQFPGQMRWLRRLAPLVDRFVAIDPTIASFLESEGGIASRRIRVIRNGVELGRYHPRTDESAATDGARPFVIGWIARLDPPKRPDLLISAVERLVRSSEQWRVRMIGPGKLTEAIGRQIADAGLADQVELLGPRTDIADQLRRMDCYVLCSEAEGLPFSLVEAMATGLPCIASSVGGIPALVEDGKNGLLLESTDPAELASSIERLRADRTFGARLGARARQSALEGFDFRKTMAEYEDLFREVSRR